MRSQPRKLDAIIAEMHPAQRAGLEVDGEPVEGSSSTQRTTAGLIDHMGRSDNEGTVMEEDRSEIWSLGDDRVFGGVDITYTPEIFRRLQAGLRCLRCQEPQDHSFPLNCDFCGYEMREKQIRDLALETKGTKHLGPSQPISEYIDRLDEEAERKRFEKKIIEGGSYRRRAR